MKSFPLEIITPEREVYDGEATALTVNLPDGGLTVLADHAPMVAVLQVGELRYRVGDIWQSCAATEGFLEVYTDGRVVVFVQACERPEEIDAARARAAMERAQERLKGSASIREYELTRIALARAMNRLRLRGMK